MAKTRITLDTKQLSGYIEHLKSISYTDMNNGAFSIVRQAANDIKGAYLIQTPRRQDGKKTGKYDAMPGNLQNSLRVFKKKQRDPFVVEFSVGFKKHQRGELLAKLAGGSRAFDGYYDFMLDYGVEGRGRGVPSSGRHRGFIQRARRDANRMIEAGLSERATEFLHRKLEKKLKSA